MNSNSITTLESAKPVLKELPKALAAFQATLRPADKDSTNPHFKSRYSSLTSVWEVAQGMTAHGLSIAQIMRVQGDKTILVTKLMHGESGETLESEMPLVMTQNTSQAMGSAISYARRYALQSMLGIVSDDDDGNESSLPQRDTPPPTQPVRPKSGLESARRSQLITECRKIADSKYFTKPQREHLMKEAFGHTEISKATESEIEKLITIMNEVQLPVSKTQ